MLRLMVQIHSNDDEITGTATVSLAKQSEFAEHFDEMNLLEIDAETLQSTSINPQSQRLNRTERPLRQSTHNKY